MLLLKGICAGTASEKRGNSDNSWEQTVLGVRLVKNDKWKTEFIQDVNLPMEHSTSAAIAELNKLKGKEVTLEVWVSSYATKQGRSGINYNLVSVVQ